MLDGRLGWRGAAVARGIVREDAAMEKPDNTYRLVVFEPVDDPEAVRDLFCRVTGITPDAMQWVARRRASGRSRWPRRSPRSCSTVSSSSAYRPRPGEPTCSPT